MSIQSRAAAQAELQQWYQARSALTDGKSFSYTTEAGTRQLTAVDLPMVNDQITRLERRVTTPAGQSHNFAVANFDH